MTQRKFIFVITWIWEDFLSVAHVSIMMFEKKKQRSLNQYLSLCEFKIFLQYIVSQILSWYMNNGHKTKIAY